MTDETNSGSDRNPAPESGDRRGFLRKILVSAAAVCSAILGYGLVRFALFRPDAPRERVVDRALLAKLEPDTPLSVPDASAWLVKKAGDDVIEAFDDKCTHLGCALKWSPSEKRFQCPCHASEFGMDGAVLKGPAASPLARLRVETTPSGVRLVN